MGYRLSEHRLQLQSINSQENPRIFLSGADLFFTEAEDGYRSLNLNLNLFESIHCL